MDNMTSEHLSATPHVHHPGDDEVEDGEIEDDPLVDVGTTHETMRVKVRLRHDVFQFSG